MLYRDLLFTTAALSMVRILRISSELWKSSAQANRPEDWHWISYNLPAFKKPDLANLPGLSSRHLSRM